MPPDTSPTSVRSNDEPEPGSRNYRSRKRRPCDRCRTAKQLCDITGSDQVCGRCRIKRKLCTFQLGPMVRHVKPQFSSEQGNAAGLPPPQTSAAGPSTSTFQPASAGQGSASYPVSIGHIATSMPSMGSNGVSLPHSAAPQQQFGLDSSLGRSASSTDTLLGVSPPNPQGLLSSADSVLQALFGVLEPPSEPTYTPLDAEVGDGVESHFLGTGTFRGLTLRETGTSTSVASAKPGKVEFRQVSADPNNPVYFVRHPGLQYGPAPENGRAAWQKVWNLCAPIGPAILPQSLQVVRSALIPALPIINLPQFERACIGPEGSIPYALLAAIIGHASSYLPASRHLHQPVWAAVLNAIDAEFRQPRLMSVQLAVLLLSSRPGVNYAQSDIALARCVGAVHVLGLHLDPTRWSLPRWERSLRTRLFWTVLIHDKMRALLMGRPSLLNEKNYSTAMPTVEDACWMDDRDKVDLSESHRTSLETFVAMCRLVPIIDRLLDGFMTVRAAQTVSSRLSRMTLLDEIRTDLECLERGLPAQLQHSYLSLEAPCPTGVRSLQVAMLGLRTMLHRVELDCIDRNCAAHVLETVFVSALETLSQVVRLVGALTPADRLGFWMPYTFHHLSNAGSLLLRISLDCSKVWPSHSDLAGSLASEFCSTVGRFSRQEAWDMAEETLKRLLEPAYTVGKDLPQARAVYTTICDGLGIEPVDELPIPETMANSTAFEETTEVSGGGVLDMNFPLSDFDSSLWGIEGLQWLEP